MRIFPYIMSASIYQPRDLFSNLSFYCIITLMNLRKKGKYGKHLGRWLRFSTAQAAVTLISDCTQFLLIQFSII